MTLPDENTAADERFMGLALDEARAARDADEVPVGAVVVLAGRVIGRGHNRTRSRLDPTAHAELLAVVEAARRLSAMRLVDAVVYTTVEPCFMCAGALLHARVRRVVWGVRDPKFGACASLGTIFSDPRLNHRIEITEGVRADEARELLQTFFRSKRGDSARCADPLPGEPDAPRCDAEPPARRERSPAVTEPDPNAERCRSG